jgi:FAD/FMN-containing dehydrogenase
MSIDVPIDTRPLRSRFAGSVIAPGDAGWDEARAAFNLTIDQRPALVAVAQDAADVGAVVRFASERNLRVAPQATGHNAAPLGDLSRTVLLKTTAMNGFSIDPEARTARVEAGVKWGPVCDAASAHGLAPRSGSARDVGVIGYSLGGGVGWLGRKHGLQCNAVTAIELVNPAGEEVRVDADHDPELFWALRGGGGNFGIVTAIEFTLVETPEIYAGSLFFGFERAREILHVWHDWCATAPDEVTTTAKLLQLPPLPELPEMLRGRSFTVIGAAFLGGEAEGRAVLEALRALGPEIDTFATVEPAALSYLAMDPEDPMPYRGGSQLFGDLSHEAIDAWVDTTGPGSGSTLAMAELRQLGGVLGHTHDDHGVRDMLNGAYLSFVVGAVMAPELATGIELEIDGVRRAMAMYEVGQYLNFCEIPTDPSRIYAANALERLRALKAERDPRRVLHANHDVGS